MEREGKTYQIRPGYTLRALMDEYLVIPVGPPEDTNRNIAILSPVAHFLWQQLTEARTMEQLVKAVTDEFDVDAETAMQDIAEFLSRLEKNNYLEK